MGRLVYTVWAMCDLESKNTAERSPDGWRWWVPAALILGVGSVYANSLGGVFLFDDLAHIVGHERIRSLWPIWDSISGSRRPVVDVTFSVNYAIAGGLDPVAGFHLVNILIHGLATLTLFGVVRRTVVLLGMGCGSVWVAFWTALIWGVHPLNTQSVTYVVQRSESLMGLCYLLLIYCVVRGAGADRNRRTGPWWFLSAVLVCALGMGSKAVMVTAPVVTLLFDGMFLAGSLRAALRRRWVLYSGLAVTWLVLVLCGVFGSVWGSGDAWRTVGFGVKGTSAWGYLISQSEILLHYLRLSVWPVGLCLDYGWPVADGVRDVLVSLIVIAGLVAGSIWAYVRRYWAGFAGLWFFIVLAPTSSLVPIRDLAFEHRMYLPLAGVVVLIVGGVAELLNRISSWRRVPVTRIGAVLALAATIALGTATIARNTVYSSRIRMWEDVATRRPENPRGWYNLGTALFDDHQNIPAVNMFRKTIDLDPGYADAQYNLGKILAEAGRCDLAVAHISASLKLWGKHAPSAYNLGKCLGELGRQDEGVAMLRKAIETDPQYGRAWIELGRFLSRQGAFEEAISCYETALDLDPDAIDARYNLGNALVRSGRVQDGIEAYHELLLKDPGYVRAWGNMGNAMSGVGRTEKAIIALEEAVKLDPLYVPGHYSLGRIFAAQEKKDRARVAFETVLRLNPDHADARRALAELE